MINGVLSMAGSRLSIITLFTAVVLEMLVLVALHSQSLEERRSLTSTSVSLRAVAMGPILDIWMYLYMKLNDIIKDRDQF